MRKILLLLCMMTIISACDYDEDIILCDVTVQLVYPQNSIEPYQGVRVELKDATASIFVDSTDASGVACFHVPPGIYEASSTDQLLTYEWRYFFNGVKSYNLGVDDSTDPSGIDAEASIKNGAHIIYLDTNNSTNDFHMRQKFSLRGE